VPFDYERCPEFAGPQSESGESDFSKAEFAVPGWRIGRPPSRNAYPDMVDPARAAIEHTIAAERAADMFKSAPADALDLTAQPVSQPPPKRRHRRVNPLPDAETAEPEPADTPEDAA
jgi:hypothetical protein